MPPRIWHRSLSPSAEKLLRAVIEKNPEPTLKGWACLALGRYFKHWSERVRRIRDDPKSAKAWEAMFLEEGADKEYFSRFAGRDPDVLMKEAEAAFERTIKEFGDTSRRGDSLKKDAQAELYEIRELCAGKPAPEITGQDIDGRPLKLSDFKRKVVVIDFWTTSCGACRDMNAFERQLVKRMRGKPFALLGVNCDEGRRQAQGVDQKGRNHLAFLAGRQSRQRQWADLSPVQRPRLADTLHPRPPRDHPP